MIFQDQQQNCFLKQDCGSHFQQFIARDLKDNGDFSHIQQNFLDIDREVVFIENLKKNSHKIKQLIRQLHEVNKDNILKAKIIENSLKKELKLKLIISEMQTQISVLIQQKNNLQIRILNIQQQKISTKNENQVMRIMEKFKNCIQENEFLRNQINFLKTNNLLILQLQIKELKQKNESLQALTFSLEQQNKLLKKQIDVLQYQLIDLQRCKSDCHFLKLQNMKIHSDVEFKLAQQHQLVKKMMKQLSQANITKQIWQQKYDQLSQIINVVDQMRQTYKFNKKHQHLTKKGSQTNFKHNKILFQQTRC